MEGKDLEANDKASREGVRVLVTPDLDPGKTYAYKVEATIEPNNYTKIVRTREITFKAGETVDARPPQEGRQGQRQRHHSLGPDPAGRGQGHVRPGQGDQGRRRHGPGCGDAIMSSPPSRISRPRGIGTDIDPKKVKTGKRPSRRQAEGQDHRKEGNALKLSRGHGGVTVIMFYMGNELNIRFRPILWEHLSRGARSSRTASSWAIGSRTRRSWSTGGDYGERGLTLHVWTVTGKEKGGTTEGGPCDVERVIDKGPRPNGPGLIWTHHPEDYPHDPTVDRRRLAAAWRRRRRPGQEGRPATIKLLIPDRPTRTEVTIEGRSRTSRTTSRTATGCSPRPTWSRARRTPTRSRR